MNKRDLDALKAEYDNKNPTYCFKEESVRRFAKSAKSLLMFDYENPCHTEEEFLDLTERVSLYFHEALVGLAIPGIEEKEERFFASLPAIRRSLNTSVQAIYEGDPAALSKDQIVLEYPGFLAILYFRLAHALAGIGLPFLARYLSELAHSKTGIDINPGAEIGDSFFIDHGTGIVIGETCRIGSHVKLYQGVTLGALSLSKGRGLAGEKRHPTVEDGVTIYSNAAIFGGGTVIGHGSTIGGNVYLTHSVPPNSIVLQSDEGLSIFPKR